MKQILIILSLVAVAALSIAGCGDSSSAETNLSKKQFIARAESICKQAEKEQTELGLKFFQSHPGAEEEEALIPAGIPPIEKELNKLRELGSPSSGQAEVDRYLEALEKAVEEAKEDPAGALAASGGPFEEPNELAQNYGLKTCANNP